MFVIRKHVSIMFFLPSAKSVGTCVSVVLHEANKSTFERMSVYRYCRSADESPGNRLLTIYNSVGDKIARNPKTPADYSTVQHNKTTFHNGRLLQVDC